jgi:hypothetical protein
MAAQGQDRSGHRSDKPGQRGLRSAFGIDIELGTVNLKAARYW